MDDKGSGICQLYFLKYTFGNAAISELIHYCHFDSQIDIYVYVCVNLHPYGFICGFGSLNIYGL